MRPFLRPRALALVACGSFALVVAISFGTLAAQARQSTGPRTAVDPLAASSSLASAAQDPALFRDAAGMLARGQRTFRFDTFGNEAFWGGALRLHETLATLPPAAALQLGLKVDAAALPPELIRLIRRGRVDLQDPAVTQDLLRRRAVVGVTAFFAGNRMRSVGIQCALCHSTVDDSVAPGIGRRLDGWPNRDLDVGQVIAAAPDVSPFANLLGVDQNTVRQVLRSWGPGKFDAELLMDGKAFRPDGKPAATLIPPAFGLAGVNLHTWTGWGSVTHWNGFVANLEMQGKGNFFDPRLDDAERFPIAAREGFGHRHSDPDRVTAALPDLHFYQLALKSPKAPSGRFDRRAADRGRGIFVGKARCASCHVPPIYTDPGWNLHTAEEIGIDDFQAKRAPDGRYRTEPLRALWNTEKIHRGGFYHDGRFATLADVVDHYNGFFSLQLAPGEKRDLIEFLKSL